MGKALLKPVAQRAAKVVARTPGFELIKTEADPADASPEATGVGAAELMRHLGQALKRPGIAPRQGGGRAPVYSIYEKDPSKVVRRAPDGSSQVGTLSPAGRFRASKPAR